MFSFYFFRHDFIGQFSTTLREMNDNRQQGMTWEVCMVTGDDLGDISGDRG